MVALKISQDGFGMNFEDGVIAAVAGPRPHDVDVLSYVFVGGYQPIATLEPVQSLIQRLGITSTNFAMLTRPNATHIWIRGTTITEIRDPLGSELQDPPNITRSVLGYAGLHQAIQESIASAKPIILSAGAKPGLFGIEMQDV